MVLLRCGRWREISWSRALLSVTSCCTRPDATMCSATRWCHLGPDHAGTVWILQHGERERNRGYSCIIVFLNSCVLRWLKKKKKAVANPNMKLLWIIGMRQIRCIRFYQWVLFPKINRGIQLWNCQKKTLLTTVVSVCVCGGVVMLSGHYGKRSL